MKPKTMRLRHSKNLFTEIKGRTDLSYKEFAKEMGVSYSALYNFSKRRNGMTMTHVETMCTLLDLEVEELVY